jgi:cell wall-associated NlpC family hydrolase
MANKSIKCIGLLCTLVLLLGANFTPKNYREALLSLRGEAYDAAKSHVGISCSGLICRAHNLQTADNVHCVAAQLWNGCGGKLLLKEQAKSFETLGIEHLQPGDVLVFNQVHAAAYLGNGIFIDSDPLHNGVATGTLQHVAGDPWFSGPVRVLAWKNNQPL